jgi:hypothetical protein
MHAVGLELYISFTRTTFSMTTLQVLHPKEPRATHLSIHIGTKILMSISLEKSENDSDFWKLLAKDEELVQRNKMISISTSLPAINQ